MATPTASFGSGLRLLSFGLSLLLGLGAQSARAQIDVVDDAGRALSLSQPAQRIVSLSPHTTEMLFTAGAGQQVVGVVSYSDYPEQAQSLPRVGSYDRIDVEQILALKPDLVVGWKSGNPADSLAQLEQLGIPLFLSEPRALLDIASSVERFGVLSGTIDTASRQAKAFAFQLGQLQAQYSQVAEVSVFYQVWKEPLMTFKGDSLFNAILQLCGGRNPFADQPGLANSIELEAVLKSDPDVIVVGTTNRGWLEDWRRWKSLKAVKNDRLYALNQDVLVRPTTRLVEGISQLCRALHPEI